MIQKQIVAFGQDRILSCDANCSKAWGINSRQKVQLSEDPDDYAFLSDTELGEAPVDPGTYEGGHAKPTLPENRLNKWCYRECERSESTKPGEAIVLFDFSVRRKNIQD